MDAASVMRTDPDLGDLVRRSKAGDRDAFDRLSKMLVPWLSRVAGRLVRDREASRDLIQEALLQAFRNLASYDESRSFSAWVFHIARNLAINQARRRRPEPIGPDPVDRAPDPGENVAHRELSARLRKAIQSLPAAHRKIVVLRFVEGLDGRAMAARTGLSEANVRVRLYRALGQLKDTLGDLLT